jgi:hypothetical protein
MEPYLYKLEEFVAFCLERVNPKGPMGVVDQKFALPHDKILHLPFTIK